MVRRRLWLVYPNRSALYPHPLAAMACRTLPRSRSVGSLGGRVEGRGVLTRGVLTRGVLTLLTSSWPRCQPLWRPRPAPAGRPAVPGPADRPTLRSPPTMHHRVEPDYSCSRTRPTILGLVGALLSSEVLPSGVAQLEERWIVNPLAVGSSPTPGASPAGPVAQWSEQPTHNR
jgi:hypothetical protein